jgi:hypothetical protein
LDLIISAVMLRVFIGWGPRQNIRAWWLPSLATLTIGVSLGLPLLLYMREGQREVGGATRVAV